MDDYAAIAMLGNVNSIHEDAKALIAGKSVYIITHGKRYAGAYYVELNEVANCKVVKCRGLEVVRGYPDKVGSLNDLCVLDDSLLREHQVVRDILS